MTKKLYRVCKTLYYETRVEATSQQEAERMEAVVPNTLVGKHVRAEEVTPENIEEEWWNVG